MRKLIFLFLLMFSVFPNYGADISTCGSFVSSDSVVVNDLAYVSINCITFTFDNVVLDCQGHSLYGIGTGNGINTNGKNNITIRNCNIDNYTTGLAVTFSTSNSLIENINIYNSASSGISMSSSANNTFNHIGIVDSTSTGLMLVTGVVNNSFNDFSINGSSAIRVQSGASFNSFTNFRLYDTVIGLNAQNDFNDNLLEHFDVVNFNTCVELYEGSNNTFNDFNCNDGTVGFRFSSTNIVTNNTVSNGRFENNSVANLYFRGSGPYPIGNYIIGNYLGNSSLIKTFDANNWTNYPNVFQGNYYSDMIGFTNGDCFDSSSQACDVTRQLGTYSMSVPSSSSTTSSSSVFNFGGFDSLIVMLGLILSFLFWF